jgi:5-(carboxyamino)imidazole ribonucleotide synthase
VRGLARTVPVHPTPRALEATADRLVEKRLFRRLGIPTPRFAPVDGLATDGHRQLAAAVEDIGLPAILKTRRFGYDGKGQMPLSEHGDVEIAWRRLGGQALVLEERVAFDREISLIAVRGRDGTVRFWPPTENRHVDGILRISRAPAPDVDPSALRRAQAWLRTLLAHLDYVGVLTVEFFVRGDEWLANEAACRVHNSGHWTIEGAATSQFENHLRAVLGWPLGDTGASSPAGLVNLVGDVPPIADLLAVPGARVHTYGKTPAPGRKLGHVTVVRQSREELERSLRALVELIGDPAARRAIEASGPDASGPGDLPPARRDVG